MSNKKWGDNMATKWYYSLPKSGYANGPSYFTYTSERKFRAILREQLKVARLPRGMEVWRA